MSSLDATDYAAHLALVLDRVRAHCSRLLSSAERELVDLALALPAAERQALAVLAGRKRSIFPRRSQPPGDLQRLIAAGWLCPCTPADDPAGTADSLSLEEIGAGRSKREAAQALADNPELAAAVVARHGPFLRFTDAASHCLRKCRLLAWGDWRDDLSDLVRLAMGQLHAPAGTPLAHSLAGRPLHLGRFPIGDAEATDALLAARALVDIPPDRAIMPQVLALLDQARGRALRLVGHRYSMVHHLATWIWHCLNELSLEEAEQTAIMEILAEVPLSPAMCRRLNRERWRRAVGRSRQSVAEEIAAWPIWPSGEQRRWRLRAAGKRAGPRADSIWPVQRIQAWLDHGAGGNVVAEGEGVEAHALRRLAADGWQGLHCEGQAWMGLAIVIGWPVLSAPIEQVWWSPLQSLPGDWGAWGFAERRQAELAALHQSILTDPMAALDAGWRALGLERHHPDDAVNLIGLGLIPSLTVLRRICERLPGRSVAALVGRLLRNPLERSGLPDLLVWRDDELQLWEVKSPGDALGDQQWAWLEWLRLQDIEAGVLRVDAIPSRQLSLLDDAAVKQASPAAKTTASVHRRPAAARPPRRRSAPGGTLKALLLPDGRLLALGLRRPLPDGRAVIPDDPCWTLEQIVALDQGPDPSNRPLLRCLPLRGFCWQQGKATAWHLLPPDLHLALAERLEADPDGGVCPTSHVLLRPSGWCCAADAQASEPLLLDRDQMLAYQHLACADIVDDLHRPPTSDPCRVDDCAAAWGLRDHLAQQLALVNHEVHAVEADPIERQINLHLKADSAVLWLGLPGIVRRDASFLQ